MENNLLRYLRIWRKAAVLNFTILVASRIDFWTFIPSKLVRMGAFFVFALSIFKPGTMIAGYTAGEALLFFAVMNLIDVLLQIFYRGLTDHPRIVKNGDFDFVLAKPLNPLLWSTFRIVDLLDVITIPVAVGLLWYAIQQTHQSFTIQQWILAAALLIASFIIGICLNIIIASLSFWTQETEQIWRTYRDIAYTARFPPEIFPSALRLIFTYLIPILVVVSFPTKALLHRLTLFELSWTAALLIFIPLLTNYIWNKGLAHYTSASS
jgi:ABC-2 type transport system permease protein